MTEIRMFTRKEFVRVRHKYTGMSQQAKQIIDQQDVDELDILVLTVTDGMGGYEILEASVLNEDNPDAFFELLKHGKIKEEAEK